MLFCLQFWFYLFCLFYPVYMSTPWSISLFICRPLSPLLALSFAVVPSLLMGLYFSSISGPQACLLCVGIWLWLLCFTYQKNLSLSCIWSSRDVSELEVIELSWLKSSSIIFNILLEGAQIVYHNFYPFTLYPKHESRWKHQNNLNILMKLKITINKQENCRIDIKQ